VGTRRRGCSTSAQASTAGTVEKTKDNAEEKDDGEMPIQDAQVSGMNEIENG